MEKKNKPKCYNCKFAGKQFKIFKLTHLHCLHPKLENEFKINPNFSAWDTLRIFSECCNDHKFITYYENRRIIKTKI